MKKEELIKILKELPNESHAHSSRLNHEYNVDHEADFENGHKIADNLLLEYINDPEITETFRKIGKWYS
jgi:hypothetical protein